MNGVMHTSSVRVYGGRHGYTVSEDGNLDITLRRPGTHAPDEKGTNPEQLFAAAYAACFAGAIGAVARREHLTLGEIVIDCEVDLVQSPDHVYNISTRINVISAGDFTNDELAHIVREAHQTCPYSNATRGNIDVTLLADGQPVS